MHINFRSTVNYNIMSNDSGVLPGPKDDVSEEGFEVPSFNETILIPKSKMDGNCHSIDDFERLSIISEGTFGALYKCRDKKTNEVYALKEFKMPADFEDGIPSAILRQISIFNCLNHENITNSHGAVAGKQLGSNFLILDYCEYTLKDLIERNVEAIYNKAMVKYFMRQLFSGLEYIHEGLIMHRDICSENILFNSKGILKIGGFKNSQFFAKTILTPGVTELNYRAPELLFQARSYLSAIDMWSAGCIFAELLLRKPLFSGNSEIEVLISIFKVLGTPSEAIWPGFNDLFHPREVNGPVLELENEQPYNNLRKFFGAETVACYEMIHDLFLYYPNARLGAQDCLKSLYFVESPPASKSEDLAVILRSLVDGDGDGAGPSGMCH